MKVLAVEFSADQLADADFIVNRWNRSRSTPSGLCWTMPDSAPRPGDHSTGTRGVRGNARPATARHAGWRRAEPQHAPLNIAPWSRWARIPIAHLLLDRAGYAAKGIELLETSRGGDVTYHGPGQLVAYPILNLQHWKTSVGWYLRTLEAVIIDVLAEFGLPGERVEGLTGVWVRGAKVAAIGIGVRRWTTFHGIALNVDPNMAHFGVIVPCGIADRPVTSLALLLGAPPPFDEVEAIFEHCFRARFDCD